MESLIDKVIFYGVPNPESTKKANKGLKFSEILSNKIKVSTLSFYSSTSES